jgi:hypothetical protein
MKQQPSVGTAAILKQSLNQCLEFINDNRTGSSLFFILLLFLSIPERLGWLEFNAANSKVIWLILIACLIVLLLNFFACILLVVWVSRTNQRKRDLNLKNLLKDSFELFMPLLILMIRGVVLTLVGLAFFVIPGLYFYFKYNLAFFCLASEGWKNSKTPVEEAKEIIKKYSIQLSMLMMLFLITESLGVNLIEIILKLMKIQIGLVTNIILIILQAVISLFYYIYMTFVINRLLKNVR